MEYKYNGHLVAPDKINQVALEIVKEYPFMAGSTELPKIAALDFTIDDKIDRRIIINRLYNILYTLKVKTKEFNQVYLDLREFIESNNDPNEINFFNKITNYALGKLDSFPSITELYYYN